MFKNIIAGFKTRAKSETGFTLIELIIVIAIIGILVAIAIPVYGAIQDSARANAVKDAAKNGLTASAAALADDDTDSTVEDALASVTNDKVVVQSNGQVRSDTLCVSAIWVNAADNVDVAMTGPGCEASPAPEELPEAP